MTCIVGLVDDGVCYMGGDSAGVAGYSLQVRADEKVFVNDGFVMGFTSSFRMGQLLRYRFKPPRYHDTDNIVRYMSTDFVDGVRECFTTYGFAVKKDNEESGGTFLVGFRGSLFCIESDYQVGYYKEPYAAVGCGADIALGALFATSTVDLTPKDRIQSALAAAEAYSAGVRRPFIITTV